MTAPKIRLEEGTTEFERDLLRSWEGEGPSPQARQKAVGLWGAGALVGVTATTAATGATGGAIAAGLAPKAAAVGLVAVGKWLAVGAVVVTGAVVAAPYVRSGGATLVSSPGEVREPVSLAPPEPARVQEPPSPGGGVVAEVAVPAVASPPAEAASTSIVTPRRTVAVPVARGVAAPPPVVAPVASESPAVVEGKHSARELGEQVASVDRARSALAGGDAAEAIRLVDDYDARFPGGALAQEATTLRIEALLKEGRSVDAAQVADRFLSAHPTSPYAAKLRRLLGSEANR